MSGSQKGSRITAALDCLRNCDQFFEFDNRERVTRVEVYHATDADEIAAHVGNLHDLQRLRFEDSDLSDVGLSQLKDLTNLQEFTLRGKNFTSVGLSALRGLGKITKLVLDSPGLDRLAIQHASHLRSLRDLTLYGGTFQDDDLAPIAALINLEELEVSKNDRINGTYCRYLSNLKRLIDLSPSDNLTDAAIDHLVKLEQLKTLFIEGPFTDVGLRTMSELQGLETLFITSANVTDAGIAIVGDLPNLTWLGLWTPKLTDAGVTALSRCRNLTSLLVLRSSLTLVGRNTLQKALRGCNLDLVED
ncbi:MAG: hypothetical protein ABUL64_03950 [Singulisphaera sp.]